jgi:ribosomal protein L37AE/L43A
MPDVIRPEGDRIREEFAWSVFGRRVVLTGLFFLSIPAALLGYWISGSDTGSIVAVAVISLIMAIEGWVYSRMRCPRCKDRVFGRWPWMNTWASRCQHCGLSLSTWPTTTRAGQQKLGNNEPDNNEMQRTKPG